MDQQARSMDQKVPPMVHKAPPTVQKEPSTLQKSTVDGSKHTVEESKRGIDGVILSSGSVKRGSDSSQHTRSGTTRPAARRFSDVVVQFSRHVACAS
jgi:hypothetical protein